MEKTDKIGYEKEYHNKVSEFIKCKSSSEYIIKYEMTVQPFYLGGHTKGYVRGLAIKKIIDKCQILNRPYHEITILDSGCGLGELSVYLSMLGFNVIGVDISTEGIKSCKILAEKFNLDNCVFYATSLENIPIQDISIDFIIGHAALHHFIKYEKIPIEFKRVMKPNAFGYFADSFGENKLYSLFHDKEQMKQLGDVSLTKTLVNNYFSTFKVNILPTDWFVMLDKLYLKILPTKIVRKFSKYHFKIDRSIISNNRINLYLSGSILTEIEN